MGWGAIGQVVGSLIGMESGSRESHKKSRSASRYAKADAQLGKASRQDEQAYELHSGQLSDERYGDLSALAAALGGRERTYAGDAGGQDALGRLDAAMVPMQGRLALNTRGAPSPAASARWGQAASAQYQPRLDSRRALLEQEGRQRGMTNYDNAAFNRLGDQQVDIGRRSAEEQRRLGLMQQYRDQILQGEARRFAYKGPSQSYYNAQLVGQLAGTAGNAIDAYASSGSGGGYSNSPYPSDRPQGPAR